MGAIYLYGLRAIACHASRRKAILLVARGYIKITVIYGRLVVVQHGKFTFTIRYCPPSKNYSAILAVD